MESTRYMSGTERRGGRSLFGKRERRKTISLFFDVLTLSLLLIDQSIICANSSSKETGEF